jgi:hypothetical protein
MLRAAFKLPLRPTEGLMVSVLKLMDLTILTRNHTTISRRAATLQVIQPAQVPHGPLYVAGTCMGLSPNQPRRTASDTIYCEDRRHPASKKELDGIHLRFDAIVES